MTEDERRELEALRRGVARLTSQLAIVTHSLASIIRSHNALARRLSLAGMHTDTLEEDD